MIETHTKPSKGGTVSYRELPIGNDGRRADAIAEIENFCDEDYEIVSESKSKELGGIAAVGRNLLAPVNRKYVNLTFDCKETKAP